MKILITGAAGMLADEIIKSLQKENHQLIKVDLRPRGRDDVQLNVVDKEAVFSVIGEKKPDFVFHLAAETNVDLCQENPNHAYKFNFLGTENIALACQHFDVKLVYVSTAGVFDGQKSTPYTEFDEPKPINVYGQSKLQGEITVKDLLQKYFIIRAGWMVGGWELDKKFVYKIVQQIASGKKQLRAVSDKRGSPTFTKDFAANLIKVINTHRYGTYHMTNQGTCSRYEMALKIVEFLNLQKEVTVSPISSSEFPLPAPRPNSEMLRNYKLDLLGLNTLPHWEESLRDYIITNQYKIEAISSMA